MSPPIGKVSLGHLESFLSRRAEEWKLEGLESFEEYLPPHRPVTVDELILAFSLANQGEDYVYLYSMEMTPLEALEHVDLETIPHVDEAGLDDYEIRFGKAKDFLYVAPSLVEVSNGEYVNLMPYDREDEAPAEIDSDEQPTSGPCINALTVWNFKGIGPPVRIEFKPITLLYGPNSAGKSSILHAILYAREIFERHNLDPVNTTAGGGLVDLGGFASLVHDHERGASVGLKFEISLGDAVIPSYSGAALEMLRRARGVEEWRIPDFAADIKTATISIAIGWSEIRGECFVQEYRCEINGRFVGKIECDYGRRRVAISEMDVQHPVFQPGFAGSGAYDDSENDSATAYLLRIAHGDDDLERDPLVINRQIDALPRWGRLLELEFAAPVHDRQGGAEGDDAWEAMVLSTALTQSLVGPGELLRDLLAQFCYLGPLRRPPARNFAIARSSDPARWADGLAAWDALVEGDQGFVDQVSDWLADPERLGTGYRLAVKSYKELSLISPLMGMLLSEAPLDELEDVRAEIDKLPVQKRLALVDASSRVELQPCDVGAGISQVVPVVVLALSDATQFSAIEHPELHVHPRVQVRLGDLFVSAITDRLSARFLLESHSEHLLLRFLRRIRQTGEGELIRGVFPGLEPEQLAVYYIENRAGETVVTSLRIDNSGEFIDRWPQGFFEERAEELF
jgi:hypothetical protein